MLRVSQRGVLLLFLGGFFVPFFAFAGSITVDVSPQVVSSGGVFRLTMDSQGMTYCTWSRYDNDATWAWQNEPLPLGNMTAYDSGSVSGWPGPSTYRWDFDCTDGLGGVFSSSAWLSIQGGLAPPPLSRISVSPTSLLFADTNVGDRRELTVEVSNIGDPGSILSGAVSIAEPHFFCLSGCSYDNIAVNEIRSVVIRFLPSDALPPLKEGTALFTGGGGASVALSGLAQVPPPPAPLIDVSPDPTIYFNGVLVGESRTEKFLVRNTGSLGSLLSGDITLTGGDFSCVFGCTYMNITTGAVHEVGIRFAPTGEAGARMAQADFTGGGGARRYVNGDAVRPTPLTGALYFGKVIVGRSKMLELTIVNESNFNYGAGELLVPAPYSCVPSCAYTIPPRGEDTLYIVFTPTLAGLSSKTATLDGVPGSSFSFSGAGVDGYWKTREQ